MNMSAKVLMSLLMFSTILIFWNSERILTATLSGLIVFTVLAQWKGSD